MPFETSLVPKVSAYHAGPTRDSRSLCLEYRHDTQRQYTPMVSFSVVIFELVMLRSQQKNCEWLYWISPRVQLAHCPVDKNGPNQIIGKKDLNKASVHYISF